MWGKSALLFFDEQGGVKLLDRGAVRRQLWSLVWQFLCIPRSNSFIYICSEQTSLASSVCEYELSAFISSLGSCSLSSPPEEAVGSIYPGPPKEAVDPVSSGPPEEAVDLVSSGPPEEAISPLRSLWDISPDRVSISESEPVVELLSSRVSCGSSPIRVDSHSNTLLLPSCD